VIGTTETPFEGDPDDAAPTSEEVVYLLREANYLLPEARLDRDSILFVWVGSRPLLRVASANFHNASREHAIYDHQREEDLAGIITLVGGKLTTAPSFACEVLGVVGRKLRLRLPRFRAWKEISNGKGDLSAVDPRLAGIYGARARSLQRLSDERPEWSDRVAPPAETTVAEIVYTVREEKARTLGDILLRRTGLGFHPEWEPGWAKTVAHIVAPMLQWSDADAAQALRDYEAEARKTLFPPP
jgi:glycerol-3-phosphate dehydrogenase